ncbi:MAG: PAS domain S-box protein [Lentisphaerota bacterium]
MNASSDKYRKLREKAENIYQEKYCQKPKSNETHSIAEADRLFYELDVHQIELEMQNAQLQRTKLELEVSQSKYFDLYDLAPVGYFTLNREGIILEANLIASSMLSVTRDSLIRHPLSSFILPEDKDIYFLRSKELISSKVLQAFEIRFLRKDGAVLYAGMTLTSILDTRGKKLSLVTLSDITELKNLEKELLESKEEEFRVIFDNVSDGILLTGTASRKFSRANKAMCRMLGYTGKEIKSLSIFDIHPEKDLPFVLDQFDKQERKEINFSADVPLKRKDGSVFFADVTATHIKVDSKPYLMGLFHDTTKRKEAADALHESEKRFMDILHASNDAILLIDRESFVECNEATTRMLGYATRDEFLMSHPSKLSPLIQPDGRNSYEKANEMMDIAFNKGFHRFIWMHTKANGDDLPVEVSLTPIVMHGKNILHCLWRDISEIQRIQEEKERNAAEVSDLYDNAPCGYHSLDKDGIFIRVNNTELSWLGYTREELIGKKKFTDMCSPESQELFKREFPGFKERGFVQNLEFEIIRKDGSKMILMVNASAIVDARGNFIMSRSTLIDITEYKKYQKDRMLLERQLYHSQRIDAIGSLATEITHDFNNILATILGLSNLFLADYSQKDKKREYIENINSLGHRGLNVVKQIMTFAKPREKAFEALDIVPIINDTLSILNSSLNRIATVSVNVVPKQVALIMGDAVQIEQMLLNLLFNAMDAMEGKFGLLEISIDIISIDQLDVFKFKVPSGSYVKLTVKDTGQGMSPEVKQKLFDPFFSTKSEKGTGLGMPIVKRIINNHNGAIQVESELGVGTTISLFFPAIVKASK